MKEKSASQYLQEAWNAVERRSLDDLKELKTSLVIECNFYARNIAYLKKNLTYLEVAKDLLQEEYSKTNSLIADYEGTLKAISAVHLVVIKWLNIMRG